MCQSCLRGDSCCRLDMPAVMSTMREQRQWRAGDQKVDKIEMERFTALEVERVKRVIKEQEFVRFIAPFRDYSVQLVLR